MSRTRVVLHIGEEVLKAVKYRAAQADMSPATYAKWLISKSLEEDMRALQVGMTLEELDRIKLKESNFSFDDDALNLEDTLDGNR